MLKKLQIVTIMALAIIGCFSSAAQGAVAITGTPTYTNRFTNQYGALTFSLVFSAGASSQIVANTGTITVTFPAGYSLPATIATSHVTVNGVNPGTVTVSGQTVVILTPITFAGNATTVADVVISASAKIRQPASAANYTPQVNTSTDTTPFNIATFAVAATTTTVGAAAVTPNTSIEYRSAQYNIAFTLGAGGYLTSSSNIYIDFPVGTTVPNGNITGVTVNGQSVNTSGNSTTRRVTIDVPGNIDNSSTVTVNFVRSAGLKNPALGSKTLSVSTTTETTTISSNSYTISSADDLSFSSIGLSNDTVNAISQYEVEFVLSTTGELSSGAGDLMRVTFPTNFVVPSTIATSAITIENLTSGFSDNPSSVTVSGQAIDIVPNFSFSGSDEVKVTFLSGAAIRNTPIAGNFQLSVATYETGGIVVIDATVNSNPFAITATSSTVSSTTLTMSSYTASAANVTYTIAGTVGKYGKLLGGTSTITVTFQSNTAFGTLAATINTVAVTTLSSDATARTVTATVPASVSIANYGAFTLVITGVTNPAAGFYTANVKTSVETTDVTSQSYNIGSTAFAAGAVTLVTSAGANQANQYSFAISGATAMKANPDNDNITIIFPEGTFLPTTGAMTASHVTINGSNSASATMSPSNRSITAQISANATPTTVVVLAAAGVRNPPVPGSYTATLYSSKNAVPDPTNTYTITGNATSVTAVTASATPNVAAASAAQIDVAFTTGANGKLVGGLASGSSTITVDFDTGITVPASISASNVAVNGVTPASVSTNVGNRTVTITLANGQTIDNSTAVTVSFASAAGLVKSATPGNYTVVVQTSSETTNSTATNNLTLAASSSLSVGSVTVSPTYTNAVAGYTIRFTPGSLGAVTLGDTFTITFPSNTFVPTSVPTTYILVNGQNPTVVASGSGQVLTITTPVALAADVQTTVQISSSSGIINPTTAGSSYAVTVTTDEGSDASSTYSITAAPVSTITQPSVTLSTYATSTTAAYTVVFNTGDYGRLIAGTSTIAITFPGATTFGTVSATVNGVAASSSRSGQVVTITVPGSVSIGNASTATVVVSGVTNPASTASYTLSAYTSVETTSVTSGTYPITNAAAVTINSTTFADLTVNAPIDLNLQFTVAGTGGALTINSGTITLTFPAGFTLAATADIPLSSIQVNGVNAFAVSSNVNTNTLVITTGIGIADAAAVTVIIGTTSNIRNISEPGSYTITVKTSAQPVAATSGSSIFAASLVTQLTSLTVSGSPQTTLTPITWTWTFSTGSRGGIKAGTGQISFDFDQSIFTVDPIPPTTVEVNGAVVSSVSKLGSVVTITVPSNVTIGVNESVTVEFKSGAGIKADPSLAVKRLPNGAMIKDINNYEAYSSPEPNPAPFNGNPLPVVLAEYKAEPVKETNQPKLMWTTFSELDNYGFYLVRKTPSELSNGIGKELGFIRGNGTSYNPIEYSFVDTTVTLAGAYTYELYQEDYNSTRKLIGSVEFVMKAPPAFSLDNIYPNPFNPTTTIRYSLRNATEVKIYVYDVTGRLINRVVDGLQQPGAYAPQFDGSRFASGMYLVRFQAGDKVMIRKMMLVK